MISTKSTCSNPTSKGSLFIALALLLTLISCQKDTAPIAVEAALFPVNNVQDAQARIAPFGEEPILLRLDSQQRMDEQVVSTLLDPLVGEKILFCNRPLFLGGDSIPSQTNLLNTPLATLELQQANGANGKYDSHYIIRINPQQDSTFFAKTQGVYFFRFSSETENRFSIDEEALVQLL
jgi:hypothetical protein